MIANRPVASARAKPRTAYEKSWPAIAKTRQPIPDLAEDRWGRKAEPMRARQFLPLRAGLRATPLMSAAKTFPIPTPAPARPIVAAPAPPTLAAVTSAAAVDSTTTPRDCIVLRMMVDANALRPPLRIKPLRPVAWRAVEMVEMMELGTRARYRVSFVNNAFRNCGAEIRSTQWRTYPVLGSLTSNERAGSSPGG